jgi:Flp pilus assembly protein TadD
MEDNEIGWALAAGSQRMVTALSKGMPRPIKAVLTEAQKRRALESIHDLHLARGRCHMKLGDSASAATEFDKAIEAKQGNHQALYLLGVALKALGEPEAALQRLDEAHQLAPGDITISDERASLASLLARLALGE